MMFNKIKQLIDELLERFFIAQQEPAYSWTEEKNYDKISYEKK